MFSFFLNFVFTDTMYIRENKKINFTNDWDWLHALSKGHSLRAEIIIPGTLRLLKLIVWELNKDIYF